MKIKADFPIVVRIIAALLEAIGQLELAQRLYYRWIVRIRQLATQLSPQNPWYHHNLAKALLQQNHWEDAVFACQQAIALNPTCSWFYHTLGEALIGQGAWEAAMTACQQAIALSPETPWFHHNLGKAFIGQEKWQEAIAACQRAVTLDPTVFWFHYNLGEALVKQGQWEEAIATLRRAIELQPHFAWSYYYLGDALLATEQIQSAIQVYQQAIALHPQIDYLKHSLEYALHLRNQEQRITAYSQKMKQLQNQVADGDRSLKILMLTPYPPFPPKLGAIARMFHEVKCLGDRHHVVVASFMFSKEDYHLEAELENYCDLALMVMIGDSLPRQPDQPKLIHRYSSERMRKILYQLKAIDFDIVSCNFIYMAQYRELFPHAYPVLEEHNIESQLLRRCAELHQDSKELDKLAKQVDAVKAFVESNHEAQLLEAYEDQHWQKFPLRTVVSEQDRQQLDQRCTKGRTVVVKNGIDIETVALVESSNTKNILFIGTMSYYPNIDGACYFVEEILPIVWQQDPTISFYIAGSDPPEKVKSLAQDPRIKVIANPENMSDVAQECSITVVPLRIGSGTRIKIIHSMAMGLPIVSTTLGCEGLNVEDGTHLLVRDQPEEFAQATLKLVSDAELRQKLRTQGRYLVEQEYDWQSIYNQAERQMVASFQDWSAKVRC